jgi:hypothetical protein
MATRRDVREAFYDELDTAAQSLVPSDNITQEEPNSLEDLPTIVHNDDYRPMPMNNRSAPTRVERDANGFIESVSFTKTMQARFTLSIQASDEQVKENIYEQVRTYFEDYTYSASHFPDPSSIQTDVYNVDVEESNSDDATDREPPARVDILLVSLGYERVRTLERGTDFEAIESVDHLVDVGDDGTVEETYTTT